MRLLHLYRSVAAAVSVCLIAGCSHPAEGPPLATAAHVDLERYLGTWHEIASYPQWFQKGCTATTATYTKRADGGIDVLNACRKNSLDGKLDEAHGRAWVADPVSNAKLKVSFFWPFSGDYWVIDLAPDYSYAVVGHPSRQYLWILARQPYLSPEIYDGIIARLKDQGYDTARLQKTLQPH